jgi:hypothetical protein
MSETDVTVAWIELYGLIATKYLWHKELTKYVKCYKQEGVYNAERRRMEFLTKHFNSSLVICDTIFFADKNKVNSIHLS